MKKRKSNIHFNPSLTPGDQKMQSLGTSSISGSSEYLALLAKIEILLIIPAEQYSAEFN